MDQDKAVTPKNLNLKTRLSFLLKDSVIYGSAAAINKSLGLITFPVLTYYFLPAEYGLLDYFGVLGALLGIFIIFGQDSSLARFFYEYEDNKDRQQVVSQSFLLQFSMCGLIVTVMWLGAEKISIFLTTSENTVTFFRIILMQTPFIFLVSFCQNLLRWSFERKKFLIISLGTVFAHAGMTIIGLVYLSFGLTEVLSVGIYVNMVFSILGLYFIRSWLVLPKKFDKLLILSRFAVPFGIICTAGAFIPMCERVVIDHYLSASDMGLYAAATRIAMIMTLFISAFQIAWGPFAYSIYKKNDSVVTYNQVLRIYTLLSLFLVIIISALGFPILLFLAGRDYAEASLLIFPIAFGLALESIGFITELGISLSKRSYLQIYVYLIYLGVTLFSIIICASLMGLFGIALGVCIGRCVKTLVASFFAQRAYLIGWDFKRIFRGILVFAVTGTFLAFLGNKFGVYVNSASFIIMLVIMIYCLPKIILKPKEKNRLYRFSTIKQLLMGIEANEKSS